MEFAEVCPPSPERLRAAPYHSRRPDRFIKYPTSNAQRRQYMPQMTGGRPIRLAGLGACGASSGLRHACSADPSETVATTATSDIWR